MLDFVNVVVMKALL